MARSTHSLSPFPSNVDSFFDSLIFSTLHLVHRSLGQLNYLRVWHDNSGRGPLASWFLKYVIVRDLQTMGKSYFICQKWLAVEKGGGVVSAGASLVARWSSTILQVERLLPVASESEKRALLYLFSKKAYRSLSDDHLWFSIFSRPPPSSFTRVQRCTCCFVLLFTAMLLNILYYGQATNESSETKRNGLSLGPFYFTREQVYSNASHRHSLSILFVDRHWIDHRCSDLHSEHIIGGVLSSHSKTLTLVPNATLVDTG